MYGDKSFGLYSDVHPTKIEKYTGPASAWIQTQSKAQMSEWARSTILMGHTRWPSHGAVTKANCHPFALKPWVACHNGCISNSGELMLKATLVPKGETDSEETLAYIVSQNWSKESMREIHGGYAFCGIREDMSEGILVCDDRQRMHYARLGDGFVWCTDGQALSSSLAAAGLVGDAGVQRLSDQILHLHTGQIEELGMAAKGVTLSRWEQESLYGTQTGGRSSSSSRSAGGKRANGRKNFERQIGYTSEPLDVSIGRRMREEPIWPVEDNADLLSQRQIAAEIEAIKSESQEEPEQMTGLNSDDPGQPELLS